MSFEWIFDVVVRKVDNYEGRLMLDDQVASEDKKSIGSVGSGFDNVQCDNRLNKMICWTLGIK